MPVRRTPAQRAASKRNLVKARAARARAAKIGTVKNVLPKSRSADVINVYHTTTAKGAKGIIAHGFRGSKRFPKVGTTKNPVWVSTLAPSESPKARGSFLVPETFTRKSSPAVTFGFRIKKSLTKPDPHARQWRHSRMVPAEALSGVKLYKVVS